MDTHNFQILVNKSSTCYGDGDLNIEYLDENSDAKKVASKKKSRVLDSIHYIAKEEMGRVQAGGFLHKKLVMMTEPGERGPNNLSNSERKKRIHKAWSDHLEEHGKPKKRGEQRPGSNEIIGHKMVFSLSYDFETDLLRKGINPDAVLQISMKEAMAAYQKKYCEAGDSIGYAYGIHHDQDNTHLHLFMCPTSAQGKTLGMSNPLKDKIVHQEDHIGLLKVEVAKKQEVWKAALADPQKRHELVKRYHNAEWLFIHAATKTEINYREEVKNILKKSSTEVEQILQKPYTPKSSWESQTATQKQLKLLNRQGIDHSQVKNRGHAAFLLSETLPKKGMELSTDPIPTRDPHSPIARKHLNQMRSELVAKRRNLERARQGNHDQNVANYLGNFLGALGIRQPRLFPQFPKKLFSEKSRETKKLFRDYRQTRDLFNAELTQAINLSKSHVRDPYELSPKWKQFYTSKQHISSSPRQAQNEQSGVNQPSHKL